MENNQTNISNQQQNKLKTQLSNYENFGSLSENAVNYPINQQQGSQIRSLPLQLQQEKLMQAFIENDNNYIYKFDEETIQYRENKFIKPISQLALSSVFYLVSSNFAFYKFFARNNQFDYSIKLAMFLGFNLLPQSYFAYKGMTAYNNANEFLYNKYLNKQLQQQKQ